MKRRDTFIDDGQVYPFTSRRKFNISYVYYLIWLMAILIKRRPQYRKILIIDIL